MQHEGGTDRDATFRDLVLRNQARLRGIARSYGQPETDDLLQEILLQLWRSIDRFRGDARIDTWCYRVALNTAISWRRRRAAQQPPGFSRNGEVAVVTRRVDAENEAELVHRFGKTLSEVDRAIFLMFLDDLDYASMSEVLGISEGAIRVRVHRIKQRLADWEPLDT